jgi:hypothetical protein
MMSNKSMKKSDQLHTTWTLRLRKAQYRYMKIILHVFFLLKGRYDIDFSIIKLLGISTCKADTVQKLKEK